ncbi:TetR/AcrR family transcriptional regulator [Mycolicibacterium nivoides]|uniref:TetR/AcrR family transcriptional regulator n=1 Tax=Mycolicibacterium nivoides TaxID=2487344 RepID=UPI0008B41D1F|nr:TetR/AcrR family transcriptional regulator [Mycolicibacterium nivoides]SER77413.1 DNA-binding transcriptional regulator, AcrR family [Mycobacterium sp. 88mf]SFG66376.1 DNA-binding transcriptional regulator, AcrR family [Mycobacterium sp. 455mf]
MSSRPPAQSRRRGAALESAILDAAWDQLLEAGYERFTIDAVASRSETARSVLYRRWPSRMDLLEATIRRRGQIDEIKAPDTGSLRDDVLAVLHEVNDRRSGLIGLFTVRLSAYFDQEGGTPARFRTLFLPEGRSLMDVIVERAAARGELGPNPLPERIKALPSDLLRHDLFMSMRPASPEAIAEIVDGVFLPLAMSVASSTRPRE